MYLVLCTNTHRDVTDSVNHGMVKNTKTWISWEWNIIFLRNEKILNLCLRWHILRSYHFVAEVTLKEKSLFKRLVHSFSSNLVGALTVPLLLKMSLRKLESWFILWGFFLLRLLFISINLLKRSCLQYCCHVWLTPLVATWMY